MKFVHKRNTHLIFNWILLIVIITPHFIMDRSQNIRYKLLIPTWWTYVNTFKMKNKHLRNGHQQIP